MEGSVDPNTVGNGVEIAQFGWVAVAWYAKKWIADIEDIKKQLADKADHKEVSDAMERKFDRVDKKLDRIYDMMYSAKGNGNRQGSRPVDYNIGD